MFTLGNSPCHLSERGDPHYIIELHPLDEDPDKADEGKLHKGEEDHGETEHDIEIHSSDPATGAGLATTNKSKTDGDHGQDSG